MNQKFIKDYTSLFLLFLPGILFASLLFIFRENPQLNIQNTIPYLPYQFWLIGIFGIIATIGGYLDWRFHRVHLHMKISKKERDAEATALGTGGLPLFICMFLAMLSSNPSIYLIPILLVLIYTVVTICYDEFVFHIKRCGKQENIYHRILVAGNGLAWLSWFHFIYY